MSGKELNTTHLVSIRASPYSTGVRSCFKCALTDKVVLDADSELNGQFQVIDLISAQARWPVFVSFIAREELAI